VTSAVKGHDDVRIAGAVLPPNRVKIGFADSVEKRLAEHRTAGPTAKLLKAWPCKRSWDPRPLLHGACMKIDIDKLTEAELVDLNNRIVARLRFLNHMRAHYRQRSALERRSRSVAPARRHTPRRRRRPERDSGAQEVIQMKRPNCAVQRSGARACFMARACFDSIETMAAERTSVSS